MDFQGFGIPKPKFTGALRAPEMLVFLIFPTFWTPQPPIFQRASRAGNLHFPMVFKVPEPLFGVWCRPASSGRARSQPGWARLAQEFFYSPRPSFFIVHSRAESSGYLALGHQIPFPGLAQPFKRIDFPKGFPGSGTPKPKISRRASRAGNVWFPLCFQRLLNP